MPNRDRPTLRPNTYPCADGRVHVHAYTYLICAKRSPQAQSRRTPMLHPFFLLCLPFKKMRFLHLLFSLLFSLSLPFAHAHSCGNYCGGYMCGGKIVLQRGDCDYDVPPVDAWGGGSCVDSCCRTHDLCCDGEERGSCNEEVASCLTSCGWGDASCFYGAFPVPGWVMGAAFESMRGLCCSTPC